jgi:hypothetical protein
MSRIDELKKQYPHLNITLLDFLRMMDKTKTGKYLPVMCKVLESRINYNGDEERYYEDLIERLDEYGISAKGMPFTEVVALYHLSDFFRVESVDIINSFMEYMERNLIDNKDVLTYNNLEDVRNAVSLASMKEYTKELEGQIIKEYEDSTWLALRPLTFESSVKYGASTKWCTTYSREKEYFAKYWDRGVLIYFINKKTGYKFAFYKELHGKNEMSFWTAEDTRADFLELEVDEYFIPTMRKLVKSDKTNSSFCSIELLDAVKKECSYESYLRVSDEINYMGVVANVAGPGLGLVAVPGENGENEVAAGDYIMYDAPPPPYTGMLDESDYISLTRG